MLPLTTTLLLAMGAAVVVHWLLPARVRVYWLAIAGAAVLAGLDPVGAALLVGAAALQAWAPATAGVWLSLAALLGLAGMRAAQAAAAHAWLPPVVVPVGFGFWTLRVVHLAALQRAGALRAWRPVDVLAYHLFPATLLVGPIHRFDDFLEDLHRSRWDPARLAAGLERVLYGLVKCVVVAGWGISGQLAGMELPTMVPAVEVLVGCALYGTHLYFLFAGASDLAIGVGLMFGHRVVENFHWPFLRADLGAFWRSWHASLSALCRDLVFRPVHAWTRSVGAGMFAAMLAMGAWHELSLRYLLWGAWHGAGLTAWRRWRRSGRRLPQPVAVLLTQAWVVLSFSFTRHADPSGWLSDWGALLTGWGGP